MPNSLISKDFLVEVLKNNPISISDCGAAGGIDPLFNGVTRKFPVLATGFEASPAEYEKLLTRSDAKYFDCAISEKDGHARFFAYERVGRLNSVRDKHAQSEKLTEIEVVVRSIDSLAGSGEISIPDILKTDIEGHDYMALKGAKSALERTTLCVKSEVAWQTTTEEGGFAAIHDMLSKNGFLLFSKTYNQSIFGYSMSGDALYIRSIASVLHMEIDDATKRTMVLKHIAICLGLRFPEYAQYMAVKAFAANLLEEDEFEILKRQALTRIYWPNIGPSVKGLQALSNIFFIVALYLMGRKSKSKSKIKINQLRRFKILFLPSKIPLFGKIMRNTMDNHFKAAVNADFQ